MRIVNHLLEDDDRVKFDFTTPNVGDAFANDRPDTIVIHFTGGSSAESSARHLCNPSVKASAHLVVGREGEVYQLAPFNRVTWHAGRSTWKGRSGLNRFAIGIEIDNAGQLKSNGAGAFLTWFGRSVPIDEVFLGVHRNQSAESHWHAYHKDQVERVFDLCELLIDQYGIGEIVGHEEIAPDRKVDPGPAFPLDKLRDRLLGDPRDSDDPAPPVIVERALVNVGMLNIRSGPSTNFPSVREPLPMGTPVRILRTESGWAEVEMVTKGWVSSQYLKPVV